MAIKFDKHAFQEHIKKTIDKDDNDKLNTEDIQEQQEQIDSNSEAVKLNVTKRNNEIIDDSEIQKKELKKRYNLSLRPSINRKLLIESSKRGLNKSQLVEQLVENAFGKDK